MKWNPLGLHFLLEHLEDPTHLLCLLHIVCEESVIDGLERGDV
jgi:hypothetical protein